jgi:hypothetical protein
LKEVKWGELIIFLIEKFSKIAVWADWGKWRADLFNERYASSVPRALPRCSHPLHQGHLTQRGLDLRQPTPSLLSTLSKNLLKLCSILTVSWQRPKTVKQQVLKIIDKKSDKGTVASNWKVRAASVRNVFKFGLSYVNLWIYLWIRTHNQKVCRVLQYLKSKM